MTRPDVPEVVVTGLGVVSALGQGVDAFREALFAGQSGIGALPAALMEGLRFDSGAAIADFDEASAAPPKARDFMDRATLLALVAAHEASASAGLDWAKLPPERGAVLVGTGAAGKASEDAHYLELYGDGRGRFPPTAIPRIMANAAAAQLSIAFGIRGPSLSLSTACAASAQAIGLGLSLLRSGAVDAALVGGTEAPFARGHLMAWDSLRVVSPEGCRPFDRERDGMSLGEGAAFLLLERAASARARGAPILARLCGFGQSSDAASLTQPSQDGAAQAIRACLEDSGLEQARIGHVNAHGTGTRRNDPCEVAALRSVLGRTLDRVALCGTKGAHGHLLGACGAIEAVATVLALMQQEAPPTSNCRTPDPTLDCNIVCGRARPLPLEAALSLSLAFGGHNAVLAFEAA